MSVATASLREPLPSAQTISAPRLRVLHTVFSLETGGMENGVVNLCNRLDPVRFAPTICTFASGGALETRVDRDRVDLVCVPRRWNNDPTLPVRLASELRRRNIDVLHTHAWGTLVEGVVAARLARTPHVVHGEHGLLPREHLRHRLLQRWLWPCADQLLSVSDGLSAEMTQVVPSTRGRVQVIANGVDTDRFSPLPRAGQSTLRQRLGLPVDAVLVGMVARLVPVKNHAGLLRALASLKQTGTHVVAVLAGDGPLRGELAILAHKLSIADQVIFLGDVASTADVYRAIDIFVLNSDSEGMSNTILEAMASGVPTVATDVGSNAKLVHAQETGLLVPAGSSAALAQAISALVADPDLRAELGAAARRRAEAEFSLARMVREYEDVYTRLAARRSTTTINTIES